MLQVNDKVRLNDTGLETCFGSTLGLQSMKRIVYTITHVDSESMTTDVPTHVVEVDDPELNRFLLSDWCFDKC